MKICTYCEKVHGYLLECPEAHALNCVILFAAKMGLDSEKFLELAGG